jgi:hypothetical protein
MPLKPTTNSLKKAQMQQAAIETATNSLLSKLKRGMRSDAVTDLVKFVLDESGNMCALLGILEHPEHHQKVQVQKAAWVLHRAFQSDPRGLFAHRQALSHALDATDDTSVMREILKTLASPIWLDLESEDRRSDILQLALDLLHVPTFPIAVHYAAMQIIQTRAKTSRDEAEAAKAIRVLMDGLREQNALFKCAAKHEARIQKRINR